MVEHPRSTYHHKYDKHVAIVHVYLQGGGGEHIL